MKPRTPVSALAWSGIEHAQVSMAVVVQAMVAADAAGVLFTVDPVSGSTDVLTINTTVGLNIGGRPYMNVSLLANEEIFGRLPPGVDVPLLPASRWQMIRAVVADRDRDSVASADEGPVGGRREMEPPRYVEARARQPRQRSTFATDDLERRSLVV